ncbi:S8 family serine peptidase [Streptomyces sp. NPDC093250]|uniref:S8 family serine peptidase n=1 Tax=Streptomyces sp. NPDC093250 TaxID=3366036 RepID=UPI00382B1021
MADHPMDRYGSGEPPSRPNGTVLGDQSEYTGRYVVLFDPSSQEDGISALSSAAGIAPLERVAGAEAGNVAELLQRPDVSVLFQDLSAAVVEVRPEQRHALVTTAEAEPSIVTAEPERMVYALPVTTPQQAPTAFFPAFRSDDDVIARHTRAETAAAQGPSWNEDGCTWGLQAIRAQLSHVTGNGVKVAVLDTGVDTDHPDLAGRLEAAKSFVPGETVEDVHGHGTHCAGTVAGPVKPQQGPRYGVAPEARILAAKVLSNAGKGPDGQILAGMAWAVSHGARVISMSLGARVRPGEIFPQTYETLAVRALALGTLIIGAAGNDSRRPLRTEPVNRPANCPSILSVAALDNALRPAYFSNTAVNGQGGEINIAAPGWQVRSAAPGGRYQVMSGTSMATPHVAGVVALLTQAHTDASAADPSTALIAGAFPLGQPAVDVGAGLLQAP